MSKKKRKKAARNGGGLSAEEFQYAVMQGMNGRNGGGMMSGLAKMLPAGRTEQFLLGAVIGAAAAYVLSDEELRGKLMKSGIKLYSSLMGGYAEFKEQMADLQAEVDAEQQGQL